MNTPPHVYKIYAAVNDKSMSAISSELSLQQVHSRTIIAQLLPTITQIRQKYFAHKPANPMTLVIDLGQNA